jgi:hypothetical protein
LLHFQRTTQWLIVLLALIPLAVRSRAAAIDTSEMVSAIFNQQYQMAAFVSSYYEGGSVAANDVGLVDFYGDVHLSDTFGLADADVGNLKLRSAYTTQALQALANARKTRFSFGIWTENVSFCCSGSGMSRTSAQ